MYEMGIHYQGSHFYSTTEGSYYSDFDKEQCNYSKIPRYFYSDYSSSEMLETNKLLWHQCVLEERPWGGSERIVGTGSYDNNIMKHAPVKKQSYNQDNKVAAQEMLKRNFALHRPVRMYSYGTTSAGESTSHVWVLDGARMKNGKFQVHCDFGWYGNHNGWYNLWEAILDFNSLQQKLVEYIPLEGEELNAWQPYRVSDEDMQQINTSTVLAPYKKSVINNPSANKPEPTGKPNASQTAVKPNQTSKPVSTKVNPTGDNSTLKPVPAKGQNSVNVKVQPK